MGKRNFPYLSVEENGGEVWAGITGPGSVNIPRLGATWLDLTSGASVAKTDATTLSVLGGDFTGHFYDGRLIRIIEDVGGPTYGTCDGQPSFGGGNTSVTVKWMTGPGVIPDDLNAVWLLGGVMPKFVLIATARGVVGDAITVSPQVGDVDGASSSGIPLVNGASNRIILNVHGYTHIGFDNVGANVNNDLFIIPLADF